MADSSADGLVKGIGAAAAAFGVAAIVAPGAFVKAFGAEPTDELRFLARLWGTRTGLLGTYGVVVSDPATRRTMMTGTAALNVADAALALLSGSGSAATRVRSAGVSGMFAALAFYGRSQLRP